jgi:hypothetical protein
MATAFSIYSAKDLALSHKPLLLCAFTFQDGSILRVSSDPLNAGQGGFPYGGHDWLARVTNQEIATLQAMSESGIDHPATVRIDMADPDKYLFLSWDQAAGKGFKGAELAMSLVLWDYGTSNFSTDSKIIFLGVCDQPQGTHSSLQVAASSKLDFGKVFAPPVRFQKRCPWIFPSNATERAAAHFDPSSEWWECGYSPENGEGVPGFTDCGYTTADCKARGMYDHGRFGGITFQANSTFKERSFTENGKEVTGTNSNNEAKYNDFVPFVYGKGWLQPPVMNVIGGGDSTRFESVLCLGEVDNIDNVVVNDVMLQQATAMDHSPYQVQDPLLSWNLINRGDRDGAPNQLADYDGKGDPYGSMCAIVGVVHKRIAGSDSVPNVKVLLSGPKIRTFTGDGDIGTLQGAPYNQNPVWQLIDLMTWGPVRYTDINLTRAAAIAAKCDATLTYTDAYGGSVTRPRFASSVVIRDRESIAGILRGIRTANGLIVYQQDGKIQIEAEETLNEQQSSPVAGSNDTDAYASVNRDGDAYPGYVAYHFDESSMLLDDSNNSTFALQPQAIAESPNVVTCVFQDADNGYFPDSLTMRDTRDIGRAKREVDTQLVLRGIQTYDQAKRILGRTFARFNRGNLANDTRGTLTFTWQTTVKAAHLHVGQIISVSNDQWGFNKQLFRLQRITPQTNFDTVSIVASLHKDAWYRDDYGQLPDGDNFNPRRDQLPRPPFAWQPDMAHPMAGDPMYSPTDATFDISQEYEPLADLGNLARVKSTGKIPQNNVGTVPPPFVRQAQGSMTGGFLPAGIVYWAVVCATDPDGILSAPSGPPIKAVLPNGAVNGSFTIPNISWPADATGYVLFASDDPNRMTLQAQGTGTPDSLTVTALNKRLLGVPDIEFDRFRFDASRVRHSGVSYGIVSASTATTIVLQSPILSSNEFAGRDISVIGVDSTNIVPLANFRVQSHTASVLTLAPGSPNPVTAGVGMGAVIIFRSTPVVGADSTGNYVEDPRWVNSVYPDGLEPDAEVGMDLLCIAGAGAGFSKRIAGNTSTRIYIDADWTITPDATSRFIIVEPTAVSTQTTASIDNDDLLAEGTFTFDLPNLNKSTLLITAVLLDGSGNASWGNTNPMREIYIYGELGTFTGGGIPPSDVTIAEVSGPIRDNLVYPSALYVPPADPVFRGVHGYLEAPAVTNSAKTNTNVLGSAQLPPARIDLGKKAYDPASRDDAGRVRVEFDAQKLPAMAQDWREYLASYSDEIDVPLAPIESGAATPNGIFHVDPLQIFGYGEEYAPRIRDLTARVLEPSFRQGAWYYKVAYNWTDPQPGDYLYNNFAAVNIEEFDENGNVLGSGQEHKGSQEYISQNYPAPVDDVTRYAHFRSVDINSRVNTYSRGVTPEVSYPVPAAPGSPYVTGWNVIAGWGYGDDGSSYLILAPYFDRPTDDRDFQCVEFRVRLPNGDFVVLGRPGASTGLDPNAKAYIGDEFWPSSFPVDWEAYAVPVDTKGIARFGADDPADVGDSPHVTVTIPDPSLGGGEEYTLNPVSVTCAVFNPPATADGIEQYGFQYTITPPSDERYSGCTPIAVFASDTSRKIPLGRVDKTVDGAQLVISGPWDVPHDDTATVYFPGNDNVPRTNTIVPGVTPQVAGLHVLPQTTGGIKLNRADPATIDNVSVQIDPVLQKLAVKYSTDAFSTGPGYLTMKVADSSLIGISPSGITLNGSNFANIKAGTYDTQLFSNPAGVFKLKYSSQFAQTAGGLQVNQLDAATINTGVLRVGNITGAPAFVGVYKFNTSSGLNDLIAWVGHNATYAGLAGGWFHELYVGGTNPLSPKMYCDSSGNAIFTGNILASSIAGSVISLTANSIVTRLDNASLDSLYRGFMTYNNDANFTDVVSISPGCIQIHNRFGFGTGFFLRAGYNSDCFMSLYGNLGGELSAERIRMQASAGGGGIILWDSTGNQNAFIGGGGIQMNNANHYIEVQNGAQFRADGQAGLSASISYTKPGGTTGVITATRGIITNWT